MALTLRLGLTYLLITLVGLLLVGGAFVALAGHYLANERERELSAQAEIYAALLGELAATPTQLQATARSTWSGKLLPAGTLARAFSMSGAQIAGDPALGPFPSRPTLALLRPPFPLPVSQVAERQYTARLIAGDNGPIGVLELSRPTAADSALLRTLAWLVLQAAAVAALVMAAVSALLARGLARPIVGLTRRAERLAAAYSSPEPSPSANAAAPARRIPRSADELRMLERSLTDLERGLRAYLERIASLEQTRSRFYRSVSHDLRTPLTAISAALENLADSLPADQRAAVSSLEGETARLTRLVDELLRPRDDRQLTLAARTLINLSDLTAEVCQLLAGRAQRAGVMLTSTGEALSTHGDRDRLKQALINLVDNALRVSPAGGAIVLRSSAAGDSVRIAVEDQGPGVPPALREQIWERGVRGGNPATDGSAGLGLASVQAIATAHGGRAYLDSAWQPGARFVLELPCQQEQKR